MSKSGRVDLRYFSGTGNSYKIVDTCKEIFIRNGFRTEHSSITDNRPVNEKAEFAGFCFPVYAFGIPRICRKYLLNLPRLENPVDAFVLITAGDPDESGFAVMESAGVLRQKGFNLIYSDVIHMPSNWTVSLNPPSKQEAELIIEKGVIKTKKTVQHILDGVSYHHAFNYPAKYSRLGFYKDYYLFKWLGVSNLWRDFRTDETCEACGLCEKICPTHSIKIVADRPKWLKTCEQCMRCVNFCPKQAIYQKAQGSIKGKNTYHEPEFWPLNLKLKQHHEMTTDLTEEK